MQFPTFFTDLGCFGLSCCNPSSQWNYYTFTDRYCKVSSKSGLYLRWMLQLSTTQRKNIKHLLSRCFGCYLPLTWKMGPSFSTSLARARLARALLEHQCLRELNLASLHQHWHSSFFNQETTTSSHFSTLFFEAPDIQFVTTVFIYVFICFESTFIFLFLEATTNQDFRSQLRGFLSPEACTNLGDAGCTFMAGALSRPIHIDCRCLGYVFVLMWVIVGVWGELYSGEIWIVKKTWRTHSWFDLKLRQPWLSILRFLETGPWGEHDDFTPRVDSTGHPLCCPQGAKI